MAPEVNASSSFWSALRSQFTQEISLSWVNWAPDETKGQLLAFAQRMVALRRDHPVFRRRRFFKGAASEGGMSEVGDIAWLTPGGTQMQQRDWQNGHARSVALFLNGERILEPDKRGQSILDDSFLVIFNAHYEDLDFTLPPAEYGTWWSVLVDTADDGTWSADSGDTFGPGDVLVVSARSTIVLRRPVEVDDTVAMTAAATQDAGTPSSARAKRRTGSKAGEPGAATPPTPAARGGSLPSPRPALRREGEGTQQ